MEGHGDEWDEFVKRLARDLAQALGKRVYDTHLRRPRRLGSTGEKLAYLYLVITQSQTFTSIRRAQVASARRIAEES